MQKKAEFFDVTHRGTFSFEIRACQDITKLSDSFMTREELELMHAGQGTNWEWNTRIYLTAEIKETCKEWAELIPEGAFGTIKTTPRIKTMINELSPSLIRKFIHSPYTTRGERIINTNIRNERYQEQQEKERLKAIETQKAKEALPYQRPDFITNRDKDYIRDAFDRMIMEKYQVTFNYRYNSTTPILKLMKRLCSWEIISKNHRKHAKKKEYLWDLIYMKQVWDDPTLKTTRV